MPEHSHTVRRPHQGQQGVSLCAIEAHLRLLRQCNITGIDVIKQERRELSWPCSLPRLRPALTSSTWRASKSHRIVS